MFYSVVSENLVQRFNFYLQGEIHQGMQHNCDLYGLVEEVEPKQRFKVFELAQALSSQAQAIVVTDADDRYRIWVSLKNPSVLSTLCGAGALN